MVPLTERFKALPIDTVERLEKTIDLVFGKVIIIQLVKYVSNYNICLFYYNFLK